MSDERDFGEDRDPQPRASELPAQVRNALDLWRAYTTRRIPRAAFGVVRNDLAPGPGDVALVRLESIGSHKRLHLPNGRRRQLFIGDEFLAVYGDRYAPRQFEARVPNDLSPCHLVASGGVLGRVETKHQRIRGGATCVRPLGLVCSGPDDAPLNVANWALQPALPPEPGRVPLIAVLGSSMDSGKTTSVAHLASGLGAAGLRVGYAKVTGTGAAGDPMLVSDAGADVVLDFTDVGHASTYRLSAGAVESIFVELVGHLQAASVDVALIEVADGLLQKETAALASGAAFRRFVDGCFYAAPEAMAMVAGTSWMRDRDLPLLGMCGSIETAPLQVREAQDACGTPFFSRAELSDPATATKLLALTSAPRHV